MIHSRTRWGTFVLICALAGCASHTGSLPAGTQSVGEPAARTEYTALQRGWIYIVDPATGKTVHSMRAQAGETIEVDAPAGKITGAKGATVTIPPAPAYRLHFRPAESREYHPATTP
jgi:hypothetical protein